MIMRLLPRNLHPGAWWGWAIGCAVVASRTTNPLLLVLLITICCLTVALRRGSAPWAMAFRLYVLLAVFIVALRLIFRIVFSANGPTVLVHLPVLALPGVFSSVHLFGPVSAEALLTAGTSAMQLAAMIIAIGAANALANPKRLLAAVPGALYTWGTVTVIAVSVFPQLAESVVRVHRAQQLRRTPGKGAHLIRQVALPVLADGLDRSLTLAGAMDSRGYGRSASVALSTRNLTSFLLMVATVAICVGAYGLLDTGRTPIWLGASMVLAGLAAGSAGLRLAGRRVIRTRYRPDKMAAPEWLTIICAAAACVGAIVVSAVQPQIARPSFQPLAWPPVSLAAIGAVLVLILPAFLAPPPEEATTGDSTPTTTTPVADHRGELLRPRNAAPGEVTA